MYEWSSRRALMLEAFINSLFQTDGTEWNPVYLWHTAGWFVRGTVILLALMFVQLVAIVRNRLFRHHTARQQTRAFVHEAAPSIREGRIGQALDVAKRNQHSHVATVVAAGLYSFANAPAHINDSLAIDAAKQALRRAGDTVHADLKVGLNTLTSIASSAPLVGLFGTEIGILNSFVAFSGPKSVLLALISSGLSQALITAALGLLVAVPAVWFRDYFRTRLELFDSEISNATLETITYLRAHPEWRNCLKICSTVEAPNLFAIQNHAQMRQWEIPYDRQRVMLSAMWFCAVSLASIVCYAGFVSLTSHYEYQHEYPVWEAFGGQESVSPDRRYRAVVPVLVRERVDIWPADSGYQKWSCPSEQLVVVKIIPYDPPPAWKECESHGQRQFVPESYPVLLSNDCTAPVIMWRTSEQLLVQTAASPDKMRIVKLPPGLQQVRVVGLEGETLHPQIEAQSFCAGR